MKRAFVSFFIVTLIFTVQTRAQGFFDSETNWEQIGEFQVPGSVSVSGEGDQAVYTITGNGNGLGDSNNTDEGYFVYTEQDGSWSLQGRVSWNPTPETGSVGFMLRENAENPNSRHFTAVMRVNDSGEHTQVRFRNLLAFPGLPTTEILTESGEPLTDPGQGLWLRITHVKSLFLFVFEYSLDGNNWTVANIQVFPWATGTLAYGLFIANDQDNPETVQARFQNVSLTPAQPVVERRLSKAAFQSNDTINVTLNVHNSASEAANINIQEILPEGWSVQGISNGGIFQNGAISWNLTNVSPGVTSLSYQAVAPASPNRQANWRGSIVDGLPIQGKAGLLLLEGGFDRVSNGILALYTFGEGEGNTIRDISGTGDPMDLTILTPQNVIWGPNSINVVASSKIHTSEPADKLYDTFWDIDHDGSITVEAWITPANNVQAGPARVVTYSLNASFRNFTLGQQGDFFQMRLRTGFEENNANRNGTTPHLETPPGSLTTTLTHVVYVRDSNWDTFFYINGERVSPENTFTIDLFDNWNPEYFFGLANEINEDRPWLGEMNLVAIYNRGLTESEVSQNFAAGVVIGETDIASWSIY